MMKFMMRWMLIWAAFAGFCLLLSLPGAANAQGQPQITAPNDDIVSPAVDLDGDGRHSKEEYMKAQEKRFDQMDLNHDGYLDASEYLKAMDKLRAQVEAIQQEGRNAAAKVKALNEYVQQPPAQRQ